MQMQVVTVGNDMMMYLLREDGVVEEWVRNAEGLWVHKQNVREVANEQGPYRDRGLHSD